MQETEPETFEDSDDSISSLKALSPLVKNRTDEKRMKLRKNMTAFLKKKMSSMVGFLRKQELHFMKLNKTISKGTGSSSDFDFMMQEKDIEETWEMSEGREDMIMLDISSQDNSEDMKNLLGKISKLTKMLTSMSEVVVTHGAMVDRIDYNMEMALVNVERGNKELFQAKEKMEKGCVARLIRGLFLLNVVLFFLVILKLRD